MWVGATAVARCLSLCWWHVAFLLLHQLQVERRLAALLLAAAAPLLTVGGTLLSLVPCVCSRSVEGPPLNISEC